MLPTRVVLVGIAGSGKTSLARAIQNIEVCDAQTSTVGICAAPVLWLNNVEVWDTAGQERFAPLVAHYWRDADVVIVVFETLDPQTLHATNNYLSMLDEARQQRKRPMTVALWQTKSDIPENSYHKDYVKTKTASIDCSAFTSAKTNAEHVRSEFADLVALHRRKLTWPHERLQIQEEVGHRVGAFRSGCC